MATAHEWLSLEPDEEVVWTGRPRLRRIVSDVVTFVVWALVAFAAAFVLTRVVSLPLPVPNLAVWGIAVAWTLLQAITPVRAYLRTTNTDYVLTDGSVYKKTGVWSENVTRVDVDKIQNTQLRKDLFGNLFDYGTILLSTAGGSGVELAIEDLNDPDTFRSELRSRMGQAGGREPDAAGGGGVDPDTLRTLVDEARKLRESAERIERHVE